MAGFKTHVLCACTHGGDESLMYRVLYRFELKTAGLETRTLTRMETKALNTTRCL